MMLSDSLRDFASRPRARFDPDERGAVVRPIDDAPGDSPEVKRYRRFFATHDLHGLPQRSDVPRDR